MIDHPSPPIPDGQPTWCRVRAGGGCALPGGRDKEGNRTTVSPSVPAPRLVDTYTLDAAGRRIWQLPADAWSPGDAVEIGPLPADVVVHYAIPRDHGAFLAEVPA